MAAGATANWPGTRPLPDSDTVILGSLAVLAMERSPLADPPALGAKVTFKVRICPAARVAGGVAPAMLKAVPETLICDSLTLAVELPELVKVSVRDLLLPTGTLPKFNAELLAERLPGDPPPCVEVLLLIVCVLVPHAVANAVTRHNPKTKPKRRLPNPENKCSLYSFLKSVLPFPRFAFHLICIVTGWQIPHNVTEAAGQLDNSV